MDCQCVLERTGWARPPSPPRGRPGRDWPVEAATRLDLRRDHETAPARPVEPPSSRDRHPPSSRMSDDRTPDRHTEESGQRSTIDNVHHRIMLMRPPPRFFMCGTARRVQRMAPNTLSSMSSDHILSSISRKLPRCEVPALLSRMSMPPNCLTTASKKRSMSAGLRMSGRNCQHFAAELADFCCGVIQLFLPRAQMATLAPSRASCTAVARPMPSLPPVITAILPFKSVIHFRSPVNNRQSAKDVPAGAGGILA